VLLTMIVTCPYNKFEPVALLYARYVELYNHLSTCRHRGPFVLCVLKLVSQIGARLVSSLPEEFMYLFISIYIS